MDYYHHQANAYHQTVFAVDPSPFLSPLLTCLAPQATILDVGCASGRDMLWLSRKGFFVTGFERSPGLAALARQQTGLPVITGDFELFDFSTLSYDALLLVGSLVHVPQTTLPDIATRIMTALKPDGHMLMTLKHGDGVFTGHDGRTFYLWQEQEIRNVLSNLGCDCLLLMAQQSSITKGDEWLTCVARKNSSELEPH